MSASKKRKAKKPAKKPTKRARKPPSDGPLISRADAARLHNCSRSAVTHACRPGGPLHGAVRGRQIATGTPEFAAWMADAQRGPVPDTAPSQTEILSTRLRRWRAEADRIEARLARETGAVISRELVDRHAYGHLDGVHRRILLSGHAIAARLQSAALAGERIERLTEIVDDMHSQILHDAIHRLGEAIQLCAITDGEVPPLSPPVPRPRPLDPHRLARALQTRLRELAAPKVFEVAWKAFARSAGGDRFDRAAFDAVMAARSSIEAQTISTIAVILEAHITSGFAAGERSPGARPTP